MVGTLAAFASFWVGFLARPIGGIVFGHLGDKVIAPPHAEIQRPTYNRAIGARAGASELAYPACIRARDVVFRRMQSAVADPEPAFDLLESRRSG